MIHPTAIIHPKAKIALSCEIGPFCVIGENVTLGENCILHSHVVIDGYTTLGKGNQVFPFAALGLKTQDLKYKGGHPRLEIGDENVFREGVTVHCGTDDDKATVIGSNNLLLINAHVAHDCILGNRIIMSGFAGLAGHVEVGDSAVLSGYVAVHQFCRIGKLSIIGGCSKVRQDIPPFMLADGEPAKVLTVNKIGMDRNGISEEAQTALRQAYKIFFRDELSVPNALARIEAEVPSLPEIKHLVEFIRASQRGITK